MWVAEQAEQRWCWRHTAGRPAARHRPFSSSRDGGRHRAIMGMSFIITCSVRIRGYATFGSCARGAGKAGLDEEGNNTTAAARGNDAAVAVAVGRRSCSRFFHPATETSRRACLRSPDDAGSAPTAFARRKTSSHSPQFFSTENACTRVREAESATASSSHH